MLQLALLKNEFGDLAVDSQLASSRCISGVRELLNGCICCNLVGQLSDALLELASIVDPDRIIIETSGSAFPATLAMEVNRLAREPGPGEGKFVLDGVISVIDVENWQGYEDTSYTAKLQAKYTDCIVFNKWETAGEARFERCLDRVGDLELQVAWVKTDRGWVDKDVIMGIDGALVAKEGILAAADIGGHDGSDAHHGHEHGHENGEHHNEVEVLSVKLGAPASANSAVDMVALETFLLSAPKDEVYRIKGLVIASLPPASSSGESESDGDGAPAAYILNWAFGRWAYTRMEGSTNKALEDDALRLTVILARGEAVRWKKKIEGGGLLELEVKSDEPPRLKVVKIG